MSEAGKSSTAASRVGAEARNGIPVPDSRGERALAQPTAPYPPAWIDRLTARVERLPGPPWLYYLAVGVVVALVRTVVAWGDNSYPVGTFFPAHLLDSFSFAYLLIALHYLDDRAAAALDAFRPVLAEDDAGYQRLRYELTTLPAVPTLVWSLAGMVFGSLVLPVLLPEGQLQSLKYFTSPASTALSVGFAALGWTFNAAFIYHTVHQLRLVSRIYTRHTKVNVFETGPLFALSRITATTAVALLLITYLYFAIWSNWRFETAADASISVLFVLIALTTFVWPLVGAHRLLQDAKLRRKSIVARRLEAVADELHRRAEAGDYTDMANMNHAIDGLLKEHTALEKTSTWPWEPDAVRAVVTALLLPVVLWIVTRILERFVGF